MIKGNKYIRETSSIANMAGNSNTGTMKWTIDSGATDRMVNNSTYLLHENVIGSFQLNEGELINNVLCVPAFEFNLLFVNKLTKKLN